MASARIEGFCRPPDWSSPLPSRSGVADVELGGQLGQRGRVDDRRPHLGQLPFGHVRVGAVQVVGDDQAEDGVPEELEPLVGAGPGILGAPGPVGERPDAAGRRRPTVQPSRSEPAPSREGDPLGSQVRWAAATSPSATERCRDQSAWSFAMT